MKQKLGVGIQESGERGRLVVRSWLRPGKCKAACLASAPMYSEGLHCTMGAKCPKENQMRVLSRRTLPGVKSNLCYVINSLFRLPGALMLHTLLRTEIMNSLLDRSTVICKDLHESCQLEIHQRASYSPNRSCSKKRQP